MPDEQTPQTGTAESSLKIKTLSENYGRQLLML